MGSDAAYFGFPLAFVPAETLYCFFFFDGSVLTFFGVLVQVLGCSVQPFGRVGCAPLRSPLARLRRAAAPSFGWLLAGFAPLRGACGAARRVSAASPPWLFVYERFFTTDGSPPAGRCFFLFLGWR